MRQHFNTLELLSHLVYGSLVFYCLINNIFDPCSLERQVNGLGCWILDVLLLSSKPQEPGGPVASHSTRTENPLLST